MPNLFSQGKINIHIRLKSQDKIAILELCLNSNSILTKFLFLSFPLSLFVLQDDKLQYVNTLQPKYSSIDLTEVELPETDTSSMTNIDMERENENANMLLDVRYIVFFRF